MQALRLDDVSRPAQVALTLRFTAFGAQVLRIVVEPVGRLPR